MRRAIYDNSTKKFLTILMSLLVIILILPIAIIIFGNFGQNKSANNISGFTLNDRDIIYKDTNGREIMIKVYMTKENKIVDMNLDEYVRGVVAGEMPATFEMEALKAQVVAARTYALSKLSLYDGKACSQGKGADLCDTVHCQVYLSKEERFKTWPEKDKEKYWAKITEAVNSTKGQVITFDGKVVDQPLYFAISGGKTEDAAQVFSNKVPYLQSVQSPGEEIAPKYKSSVKLSNSELASRINKAYPKAKVTPGNLSNQIKIISRNSGNTVNEIKLGNETIKGTNFRELLSLNSANFNFNFSSNTVEIICYGYGHNVGMSQWGANVMAKGGKDYIDILTHYYKGVEIKKIEDSIEYTLSNNMKK